jgi:quercetin dioxygenase-like cupin family protein
MPNPPYQPQAVELIVDTPDVRVAEITLAPGTDTPPHEHTEVEEVCYCLEGELTCEAEGEPPVVLRPGEKKRFAAGLDHRLSNEGEVPCRFLLVHGVGPFNFVPTTKR